MDLKSAASELRLHEIAPYLHNQVLALHEKFQSNSLFELLLNLCIGFQKEPDSDRLQRFLSFLNLHLTSIELTPFHYSFQEGSDP